MVELAPGLEALGATDQFAAMSAIEPRMFRAFGCWILPLVMATGVWAAEYRAADAPGFRAAVKKLQPGDVFVLEAGEWRDADLEFVGHGTEALPITLRAAQPGAVKLTGASRLRLAGEYLVVEGLWFSDVTPPRSEIIATRQDSKHLAAHCVLRDCAITQNKPKSADKEEKWVSLYGTHHLVERNHFVGKTSKGALLVVWLDPSATEPAAHRIVANYFGRRPRLGRNGGESIRVGDSETSLLSARCVVERNYFEHCDGEVECISNKSCDNLYRGNRFVECQGTLTLRHGHRCTVEGNLFEGHGVSGTGGIRIIGEDHRVIGNRLLDLTGEGTRAALCVMNGIRNTPLNGYSRVKRALIRGNIVLNCKQSVALGVSNTAQETEPPQAVQIEDNLFLSKKAQIFHVLDPQAQVTWRNNTAFGKTPGIALPEGVTWAEKPAPVDELHAPPRAQTGVTWGEPK
jgi:poly(beta-D-mannuronate) lyase